jgi:NADH:ubiquinone oxidoreductase subunit 2 (subunit N)
MIAAIVAAFLYLKVLATIWLKQSESLNIEPLSWSQKLVIGGSVTMTFVLGLYPQILLKQLVNF